MKKEKISLIIPVYNAEDYIERNIKSILLQTIENFEIIYINDGSTDNTEKIIQEYQKKYKKMKLITIKNSGVAFARNIGIENADGEYLVFIDADDYIEKDYLNVLYNEVKKENVDYLRCSYKINNKINTNKTYIEENKLYQKEEFCDIYKDLLYTYNINPVWAGIVKSKIIKENKIKFNEKYRYAEDYAFNIEILKNINTFKKIDYNGYIYTINDKSITHHVREDKILNDLEAAIVGYDKLKEITVLKSRKVRKRIKKEVENVLDRMYYKKTEISIQKRKNIFIGAKRIIRKYKLNILNMNFLCFDIRNIVLKKIPREIKFLIHGGN